MQTRRALCLMAPALAHRLPMLRRWLARRRARSAAKPARALRFPTAPRCGAAQAQSAPAAARSVRCCLPRSGRRDCHRQNRTAGSRRSQARRAPRRNPAIAPAGWRRLPAIGLRAARSDAGAGRPGRRFFRPALLHRPHQTSACRPHWPTGFFCRRPSTTMQAAGSSRRPSVADRRPRAPEIPHLPSRLHDRPAPKAAAKNQTAQGIAVSQAGDGRSTARPGLHRSKRRITLTRLNFLTRPNPKAFNRVESLASVRQRPIMVPAETAPSGRNPCQRNRSAP